jgi:hypothetical protein
MDPTFQPGNKTLNQEDAEAIGALLLGHTIIKVSESELQLDDGTVLQLEGNEGGCACNAGDYELRELNGCDNVITNVELVNSPCGDGQDGDGTYRIFVYADNRKINLATFEGSDGNGYYGTGYTIEVRAARPQIGDAS